MRKTRKPVDIEARKKELAAKRAELEQAEAELAVEEQAPMGETINGIFYTWEDLERRKRIKCESEEAERAARLPAPEKPPFIPNPYLVQKEKMELAEMMLHKAAGDEIKFFIEPRHKVIYDVYRNELVNHRRWHNVDSLISTLQNQGSLELAGGPEFVKDIFQGLPA